MGSDDCIKIKALEHPCPEVIFEVGLIGKDVKDETGFMMITSCEGGPRPEVWRTTRLLLVAPPPWPEVGK